MPSESEPTSVAGQRQDRGPQGSEYADDDGAPPQLGTGEARPLIGLASDERSRPHGTTGYRTRDEIIARFRAVPAQAVTLPHVARHIALESVRKTTAGWVWKFDPAIFGENLDPESPTEQELLEDMMAQMPCRIGYLRCEAGLVPPAMAEQIRSILQLRGPFIDLAEAGHHPMLDQPLPLVSALRVLLEFWSIT